MVRAQAGAQARPRRKWNQDCSERNGACERAVCLRYGQLVAELVEGCLLALLTTCYVVSRSHIRRAKRYLRCELCALTLGHSERSCGVKMNATSCLLDILTAGLPSWRRVASLSLGPSVLVRALQQLVDRATKTAARRSRARAGACCVPPTSWTAMSRACGRAARHREPAGARIGQIQGQKLVALVLRKTSECP